VAVAEVELLTGTDAPDVGRVEALVTVDDCEGARFGQRVDVKERATHGLSAAGEGFA